MTKHYEDTGVHIHSRDFTDGRASYEAALSPSELFRKRTKQYRLNFDTRAGSMVVLTFPDATKEIINQSSQEYKQNEVLSAQWFTKEGYIWFDGRERYTIAIYLADYLIHNKRGHSSLTIDITQLELFGWAA